MFVNGKFYFSSKISYDFKRMTDFRRALCMCYNLTVKVRYRPIVGIEIGFVLIYGFFSGKGRKRKNPVFTTWRNHGIMNQKIPLPKKT